MEILRCGRSGNLYCPGAVFQHAGELLTVLSSTRTNTYGDRGMPACPADDCWRVVTIVALPVTADEAAAYLEEEREKLERRAWSNALRERRHQEWLAKRAAKIGGGGGREH